MRIPARDAWYEAATFAKATVSNLRQPDRTRRVHRALRQWSFTADGLPRAPLAELFADIEHVRSGATPANRHFYELPYAERFVLDALIRHVGARAIFEFGTFRGMTTKLLAETVGPGGLVHTIDLPRPPGTPEADDPNCVATSPRWSSIGATRPTSTSPPSPIASTSCSSMHHTGTRTSCATAGTRCGSSGRAG